MYDLVIFDVDGTLVRTKSGGEFRKTADDWEPIEGRAETLAQLKIAHKKIALATNQGGVAMGYFPAGDMVTELARTAEAVGADRLRYSFYLADALLEIYASPPLAFYRKPAPGMLMSLMLELGVPAPRTLMVGDREEDKKAARNAGVAFCWADLFFRDWRWACKENVH